ncbi:MAG: hypothetical protein AB1696_28865 [Planctomycetota bacterium]
MDLEEQIAQITNPQDFTKLCNTLFTQLYPNDFQVIDGTRGDQGNDGYIASQKAMLAIFCPVKPEKKTDNDYIDKFREDLAKAKKLCDSGVYQIERWVFVTPRKLPNTVVEKLRSEAAAAGFEGQHVESTFLANVLYDPRHRHLLAKFPFLHVVELEEKINEVLECIRGSSPKDSPSREAAVTGPAEEAAAEKDKDLQRVLDIMRDGTSPGSSSQLKAIFYTTQSLRARLWAVHGILNCYSAPTDSDEAMADWCQRGDEVASKLDDAPSRARFLANRGYFLSEILSHIDFDTQANLKMGAAVGLSMLSQEEIQERLKEMRTLEEQSAESFHQALQLAGRSGNPRVIAEVCQRIGSASGSQALYLNNLGHSREAARRLALAKTSLVAAIDIASKSGNELMAANAKHALANCIRFHGEEAEALALNKQVIETAQKHKDDCLLDVAQRLRSSIQNGIPDYARGETHENRSKQPPRRTQTPQGTDPQAEHDIAIFIKSDQVLSERQLQQLLDGLETDDSYLELDINRVHAFCRLFDEVGNEYVSEGIMDTARSLHNCLTELCTFLGRHFFIYPRSQTGTDNVRFCMYPDLNVDRGGLGKREDIVRYREYQQQLNQTCSQVRSAYAEYRRAVKRVLLI